MTKNERRASQRFKARTGSYVSFVEGCGNIRDLSMDGMFILDSDPLADGTPVSFSVRMGNEIAQIKGIVRRSVEREGMGIQFLDVSRDLRRRLVSYMACIGKEDVPAPDPKRAFARAAYSPAAAYAAYTDSSYDGTRPQICRHSTRNL